jgi:hypothetical protein
VGFFGPKVQERDLEQPLDVTADKGEKLVLDCPSPAIIKESGNVFPGRTVRLVRLEKVNVFLGSPVAVQEAGIQLVLPALLALLGAFY